MPTWNHGEGSRSPRLHRWTYRFIIGFVLWMMLAAWGFMSTWTSDPGESYIGLVLAMASFLCLFAVGIAFALGRINHDSPDPARAEDMPANGSLRKWASRKIEVGDGHQRGAHVLIDMLLPPAGVAICMTALVIVWHLAPGGAG